MCMMPYLGWASCTLIGNMCIVVAVDVHNTPSKHGIVRKVPLSSGR